MKIIAALALVGSVSAFAPASVSRPSTKVFSDYGKYDDKLWDNDAKKEVYGEFDPKAPRTALNFNPFETFEGNSPDASGKYPGEPFYKDPMRGDVSFQIMMDEKAEIAERDANPKPGYEKGCPGCKN